MVKMNSLIMCEFLILGILSTICIAFGTGDLMCLQPDNSSYVKPIQGNCEFSKYKVPSMKHTIYCSMFCGKLKWFPEVKKQLPQVQFISIDEAKIKHLFRSTFTLSTDPSLLSFPNLISFRCLYCHIHTIEMGTFSRHKDFNFISLSWNPLQIEAVENVTCDLTNKSMQGVYIHGFPRQDILPLSGKLLACLKVVNFTILDLSYSYMTPSDVHCLTCAIKHTVIYLGLDAVTFEQPFQLDGEPFQCLNTTNLTTRKISLSKLNFGHLSNLSFAHFENIEYLDLSSSNVDLNSKNVSLFYHLNNLRVLYLRSCNMKYFTVFALAHSYILPKLEVLDISENFFTTLVPFNKGVFPSLSSLFLSNNQIMLKSVPVKFIHNVQGLKKLIIHGNWLFDIYKQTFQSSSLSMLEIQSLKVDMKHVNQAVFREAYNLTRLHLQDWNPDLRPEDTYYADLNIFLSLAFQNLFNLRYLRLVKMRIDKIGQYMFKGTTHLKKIDMSQNRIGWIEGGALKTLTSLRYLNLQTNSLKQIDRDVLPQSYNWLDLEAGYNSWDCNCNLTWFLTILKQSSPSYIRITDDRNDYYCTYPSTLKCIDYEPDSSLCSGGLPELYYLVVIVSGALCILSLLVSIVYRLRWHIHYIYINGNAWRRRSRRIGSERQNYQYDAFVAYNRLDTRWVVSVLRPALEDVHKLKLCLHDRDWPAGVDIVENIQSSIERSRKVVLVITNAFARSDWCQLELTMAQHQLFSKDTDNLILLIKEPVLDCFMTPRLALQMKSQTYIKWPETKMGRKVFWASLVKAIYTQSSSVKHKPLLFNSGLS